MSPSRAQLAATETHLAEAVDGLGRTLSLRRLGPLDRLRLFEAAGAELSRNDRWLGMAALACSVSAIDGVPYPFPTTKQAVEAMVQRLGSAGTSAVADVVAADSPADPALAGN